METPLRYSIVALCYRDPAALELQDRLLHAFQQIIDGIDVGVCSLGSEQVGSSPASTSPG